MPQFAAWLCALFGSAALIGVWAAPDAAPWLWAVLLGTAQGASFAIGMVLLVRYAVSPAAAARFTLPALGMVYADTAGRVGFQAAKGCSVGGCIAGVASVMDFSFCGWPCRG